MQFFVVTNAIILLLTTGLPRIWETIDFMTSSANWRKKKYLSNPSARSNNQTDLERYPKRNIKMADTVLWLKCTVVIVILAYYSIQLMSYLDEWYRQQFIRYMKNEQKKNPHLGHS